MPEKDVIEAEDVAAITDVFGEPIAAIPPPPGPPDDNPPPTPKEPPSSIVPPWMVAPDPDAPINADWIAPAVKALPNPRFATLEKVREDLPPVHVIGDLKTLEAIRDDVNQALGLPQCCCVDCRKFRGEVFAPFGSGPYAKHNEAMLDSYADPIQHPTLGIWALVYDEVTASRFPPDAKAFTLGDDWFSPPQRTLTFQ